MWPRDLSPETVKMAHEYLDDADSVEVDTDSIKVDRADNYGGFPTIVLEHSSTHERRTLPVVAAGRPAKLYVRWGIAGQYVLDITKNRVVGTEWRAQDVGAARELCIVIIDSGRLAHARTDERGTRERLEREGYTSDE